MTHHQEAKKRKISKAIYIYIYIKQIVTSEEQSLEYVVQKSLDYLIYNVFMPFCFFRQKCCSMEQRQTTYPSFNSFILSVLFFCDSFFVLHINVVFTENK